MFRDPVKFVLFFIAAFLLFFSFAHRWKGDDGYGWEATVDGDAKGYYAPLPAILIYGDPAFSFYNSPDNTEIARYYNNRFRVDVQGGTVHKNYIGVAVLQLPFFLAGQALAGLSGSPVNGYSWPFMLMLILGSVFYCIAGLYLVARLLRGFGFNDRVVSVTLLLISLGTNLIYYSAIHAAMPHVYGFFLIAAFAYLARCFFVRPTFSLLLMISAVTGLIVLVRPVNALVLFALPFLAPSNDALVAGVRWFFSRIYIFLASLVPALLVIFLQLAFYKIQTGSWLVWSYGDEGFRFADPHIWDVLFSWRKGLFIYTPLMLLSFIGIFWLYKRSRWEGFTWMAFIAVTVYVISSWWSWFYGDGFGLRAFVDFYPLMAVPMAVMNEAVLSFRNGLRSAFLIMFSALIFLSVIQNYQYRYRIIHPAEMNFDKYKYVFLKTDSAYRDVIGGDNEYIYPELSKVPVMEWFNDFEKALPGWTGNGGTDSKNAFSGSRTDLFNADREWGTTLSVMGKDLVLSSGKLFAVVTYRRYQHEPGACNKVYLACAVDDSSGKNISWKGFRSNEYPVNETNNWLTTEARFRIPENLKATDQLKIYLWNQEKKSFEVDDFRVEFFEIMQGAD